VSGRCVYVLERRQRLEVGDRVRYAIPLGPLGRTAHAAFVKRDLKRVFDYRARAVAERLQSESAGT
jgi:hypothetical protein